MLEGLAGYSNKTIADDLKISLRKL
ncbi:hypothetical protein [Mesorhizobium sp. WSM4976]